MYNIYTDTDAYKITHWKQYPPGTQTVYSYVEPRKISKQFLSWFGPTVKIVHFGLQNFIEQDLKTWDVNNVRDLEFSDACKIQGLNPNPNIMLDAKGPKICIRSIPEGSLITPGTPSVFVYNTDPEQYWLTSYLETAIIRSVWYPSTVATLSRETKKLIKFFWDMTVDDHTGLNYALHDFGARGCTSRQQAAIGGAAHLLNFYGTDTTDSIRLISDSYNDPNPIAVSIPASEHSTITAWGRQNEVDACSNMLDQYPNQTFACVSDSYDIYNACTNIWGGVLRKRVLERKHPVVIRPDSGDPIAIVDACISILAEKFGYTLNQKGYKVLHPNIRIIWGDGITPPVIVSVLSMMQLRGFSAENISFGMGGALLQKVDRDSLSYAMKCCAINVGGEIRPVYKDPITDKGKSSKSGIFETNPNNMRTVYEDNNILIKDTFTMIRKRCELI